MHNVFLPCRSSKEKSTHDPEGTHPVRHNPHRPLWPTTRSSVQKETYLGCCGRIYKNVQIVSSKFNKYYRGNLFAEEIFRVLQSPPPYSLGQRLLPTELLFGTAERKVIVDPLSELLEEKQKHPVSPCQRSEGNSSRCRSEDQGSTETNRSQTRRTTQTRKDIRNWQSDSGRTAGTNAQAALAPKPSFQRPLRPLPHRINPQSI